MFFDRLGMWAAACGVLLGSTAVVSALESIDKQLLFWFGLVTTVVSLTNLVVGSSAKARQYHDLVRKFSQLESDIACSADDSEKELTALECKRLEIEAEEPPKLLVLDAICHNELLVAEGRSFDSYCDIGPIQWALSDIGDWRPGSLRTRRQKQQEKADQKAATSKAAGQPS